jgi:hypothetical protein
MKICSFPSIDDDDSTSWLELLEFVLSIVLSFCVWGGQDCLRWMSLPFSIIVQSKQYGNFLMMTPGLHGNDGTLY